jgi:hypothetical protein
MMKKWTLMALFFMNSLKAQEAEKKFALGLGVNSLIGNALNYLLKPTMEGLEEIDEYHLLIFDF